MKKHSREEILRKLGQADELARAGKSQVEICKALGVSVAAFADSRNESESAYAIILRIDSWP